MKKKILCFILTFSTMVISAVIPVKAYNEVQLFNQYLSNLPVTPYEKYYEGSFNTLSENIGITRLVAYRICDLDYDGQKELMTVVIDWEKSDEYGFDYEVFGNAVKIQIFEIINGSVLKADEKRINDNLASGLGKFWGVNITVLLNNDQIGFVLENTPDDVATVHYGILNYDGNVINVVRELEGTYFVGDYSGTIKLNENVLHSDCYAVTEYKNIIDAKELYMTEVYDFNNEDIYREQYCKIVNEKMAEINLNAVGIPYDDNGSYNSSVKYDMNSFVCNMDDGFYFEDYDSSINHRMVINVNDVPIVEEKEISVVLNGDNPKHSGIIQYASDNHYDDISVDREDILTIGNYTYFHDINPYFDGTDVGQGNAYAVWVRNNITGEERVILPAVGNLQQIGNKIYATTYVNSSSSDARRVYCFDIDGSNITYIMSGLEWQVAWGEKPYTIFNGRLYLGYDDSDRCGIISCNIDGTDIRSEVDPVYAPNRIFGLYEKYAIIDGNTYWYRYDNTKIINIIINNQYLSFDQPPIIYNDRTIVPLRAIFEALGATVTWNQDTKTVTATKAGTVVSLVIGDNYMYVNGNPIIIDVPAMIINDRTLVPVRAISEAFGCNVTWDQDTRTVSILYDDSSQCSHINTRKIYMIDLRKYVQTGSDEYHEMVEPYELICNDCGETVETNMIETHRLSHSFYNGVCTVCGYSKN